MARLPRLVIPNQPHHLVQFGVDRQVIFRDPDDYQTFLNWLRDAARQYKVAIHAYVLMPNHVHLLATPDDAQGLARMMQWIGRHYVPYFNRKYTRVGTLWQGRFKATVVEAASYLLMCSRYIECNPVRAGMVANPLDYDWSSYRHHIGLQPNPMITDHPLFWALGNTPFSRDAAYKKIAEQPLSHKELNDFRETVNKGWVLGSDAYKFALQKQVGRQVSPGKRGRPSKSLSAITSKVE